MQRRLLLMAAAAAVLLWLRMPRGSSHNHPPVGQEVRVASAVPCFGRLPAGESVRVVRRGRVILRTEEMPLDELDARLAANFRDRTQRVVFLGAGEGLQFRDVAEVIAMAKKHADYVVLVPPRAEQAMMSQTGLCLDPHITFPEILM